MTEEKRKITSLGTIKTFLSVGACSEALMNVLDRSHGFPMVPEEHASSIFAGGILQRGYQCGMLWGAALAAGAEAHRRYGTGAQSENISISAARKLVEAFRPRNDTIDCAEIAKTEWGSKWQMFLYMIKGGPIGCIRMSAWYAGTASNELNEEFSKDSEENVEESASCSALLARKAGASELHSTMLSGFAGGIGLSGGACGALGAALWLLALKHIEQLGDVEDAGKNLWDSKEFQAKAEEVIESFLKRSDYEFTCSKIVGKNV